MTNIEMPQFKPPEEPIRDPSMMAGNTSSDNNEKFLQEGMLQLGENIMAVAQQDPTAVGDYMTALLEEREYQAPSNERAALFNILAATQKAETRYGLVASSGETVQAMHGNDRGLQKTVDEAARPIGGLSGRLAEFGSGIARAISHGNLRGADQAQQAATADGRNYGQALSILAGGLGTWRQAQGQKLAGIQGDFERSKAHEQALKGAAASLLPDYEGEPKDLTKLINPTVIEKVGGEVAELLQAASEASQPLDAALESYMASAKDERTLNQLRFLGKFLQDYRNLLAGSNRASTVAAETNQVLTRLARSAHEPYSRMDSRRIDVPTHARSQGKLATDAAQGGTMALRVTKATAESSADMLKRAATALG